MIHNHGDGPTLYQRQVIDECMNNGARNAVNWKDMDEKKTLSNIVGTTHIQKLRDDLTKGI